MTRWVGSELQRRRVMTRLQEKNEQLERFASIVSHDLRNPLNVAQGRSELAAEECDSEHLERVMQAHDRMETLIDELLDLALEGEEIGETERVDPAEVIASCWENVDTRTATLDVRLERPVRADSDRLRQLFENLIGNAVEHGRTGVAVTVGELDDGIYFEDDGPGIPADEREEVFEAGYSTSDEGTGVGLRIVEQVVDAHGWDIRIAAGSDGGTRFEITGLEWADR